MRLSKDCAIKFLPHVHACDISHNHVKFGACLDECNKRRTIHINLYKRNAIWRMVFLAISNETSKPTIEIFIRI